MTTRLVQNSCSNRVSLGQVGIQCECLFSRSQAVIACFTTGKTQVRLPQGHERPGVGEAGVDLNDTATYSNYDLSSPGIAFEAGDVELPRHEVKVVGLDTFRAALTYCLLLFGQQLEPQGFDDRL